MENYFNYFLKVNTLLALFYVCYFLFLKKETYFNYNRFFLLSGLFASIEIPFISFTKIIIVAPIKEIISESISNTTITNNQQLSTQTAQPIYWEGIIAICYLSIVFIFIIKILREYYLYKKVLHNQQFTNKNNFRLFEINSNIEPFSFFKTIVYNPSLHSKAELEFILAHEKIHAQQFHSIDVLISKIFSAVFWYNPIVWFYKKSIIQNLEFIADAGAISKIDNKKQYQYTLLKNTTNMSCVAISNHFYQSLIKKRIVMLNKKPSQKANFIKLAIVVPLIALFIIQFQTKIVAQEKFKKHQNTPTKSTSAIEPIVITKNSTDEFFQITTTKLKSEKNIDLEFSRIKRNSKKEITRIKVKFDDHKGNESEHEVESDKPIEDFSIVYDVNKNGNGEIGFYSKTVHNGVEISLSTNNKYDIDTIMHQEEYAVQMPTPPSPPTPPSLPTNFGNIKQPKFEAPKPPKAPRNLNDPEIVADFEKKMQAFEKQMDATSKKFDEEMEKFTANQDKKMEEYNKQMNEYDKKMNEYDQKMNEYHNKMETYSEGTSIQKAADIEKRRNDVRRIREMITEKRQQIQSR